MSRINKRVLLAVPPAALVAGVFAAEAFAGHTPQHAQLRPTSK